MIKKPFNFIAWFPLIIVVFFCQINLLAIEKKDKGYQPYQKDEPLAEEVTTTLINNSKYSLWVSAEGESLLENIRDINDFQPFGFKWIQPEKTLEVKSGNSGFAPTGSTHLYFTEIKNPNVFTSAPHKDIKLEGVNETYSFKEFDVKIEAVPVKVWYSRKPHFRDTDWTYTFYNYTITVTGKENPTKTEK